MPKPRKIWYCVRCGVQVKPDRQYCDACRSIRSSIRSKKAWNKIRQEQPLKEESKKKQEPKVNRVREITRLADAEGLSYGKYCLKHGI